jgi:cell wall-associated NlpC family hydrolase
MTLDRYVGISYLDRGRSTAGLDCYGLVWLVYREQLGIDLPSFGEDYVTAADIREIAALIDDNLKPWREIPRGQEQPFDGVLMRELRQARHIGLVTQPGQLLHVSRGETSRIERYRSGPLAHRITGFYRYCP